MWYLLLFILPLFFIPFKLKVVNHYNKYEMKVNYLIFHFSLNLNRLKKWHKESRVNLIVFLYYLSSPNLIGDLIRTAKIEKFKVIRYIDDNNYHQTYPVVSYYLFVSIIEGWLEMNHKNYNFEKVMVANSERSNYEFYLLMKINLYQIIYCALKNLKDITRFMKKERVINGS